MIKWLNSLHVLKSIHFRCSRIFFGESNTCAEKLASFGHTIEDTQCWSICPSFIRNYFISERFGLSFYRIFCSFHLWLGFSLVTPTFSCFFSFYQ